MATLTLAGIQIPIGRDSWQQDEPVLVGRPLERRFSGRLGSGVRAVKRRWMAKTPLQPLADVAAYEGLIRGDGHHWSFDADLFSDKGLGPDAGHNGTQGAGGKWGGRLSVASAGVIQFRTGLTGRWSVALWRWESVAWRHYVINSDGTKFKDGVLGAYTTTFLANVVGTLTLYGGAGAAELYDDVLAVPYLMPAGWPAQLVARATALPAVPELDAVGDVIVGGATVRGRVAAAKVQHLAAGEYAELAFALEEV